MSNIIELKDVENGLENVVLPILELFMPNYAAQTSLAHAILKLPSTIRDYRLYQKIDHFIKALHKDMENSVKFSYELFGNKETAKNNGLRLIQYIDRAESLTVIDFIVNASRAAGNRMISDEDYFRILWALTNTFPEGLYFFKSIATKRNLISGNTKVIALAQSGLMLQAETDGNKTAENQGYIVTSFGRLVDKYALSFDDEQRWKDWHILEEDSTLINYKTEEFPYMFVTNEPINQNTQ